MNERGSSFCFIFSQVNKKYFLLFILHFYLVIARVDSQCTTCFQEQCICSLSESGICPDWFQNHFSATSSAIIGGEGYCAGSNTGSNSVSISSGENDEILIEYNDESYGSMDELEPCSDIEPMCSKCRFPGFEYPFSILRNLFI